MAISQRLNLVIAANAGQAQAAFGQLRGGFLGLGQSARQGSRDVGLMNSQMRALGTTMKYMFAGAAVYGTMNMVRNLAQFQQQLGLVSAIGSSAGFTGISKNLEGTSRALINAAVDTVTPVDQMTNAFINLLSTVQKGKGVPESSLIPSLKAIAEAATLSQTPIEDMTKALTTMNVAFGRQPSTRNIEDFAARWTKMIAMVPGGVAASPQLVGQMGRLSAMSVLSHTAPGQMLAMLSGTLRFGLPPSQAGQGLAYFLQTLGTPQSPATIKSAREMWGSFGITSNEVAKQMGGWNVMKTVFKRVEAAGIHGDLRRAGRRAWATRDDLSMAESNSIRDLGISGPGVDIFSTLFRRQHAVRTAIALYAMWKTGRLDKDMKILADTESAHIKQVKEFAQMWKKFSEQSGLAKAGVAMEGLRLQVAQALSPVFDIAARGITGVQHFANRHPDLTKAITRITAGALATLGLNKIAGNPLGAIFKRVPGVGRLLGKFGFGMASDAAFGAKLVEDLGKSTSGLRGIQDGSPDKPFYVVVLHNFDKGSGTGPGPGSDNPLKPSFWEKWFGKAGGWLGGLGLGAILRKRLGPVGRIFGKVFRPGFMLGAGEALAKAGRVAGPAGVILSAYDFLSDPGGHVSSMADAINTNTLGRLAQQHRLPLISAISRRIAAHPYANRNTIGMARLLSSPEAFKTSLPEIERALESQNKPLMHALKNQNLTGDIWLNIDLTDKDGKKTHARVHLPPDTFTGGKSPGSRGRPKQLKVMPHQ